MNFFFRFHTSQTGEILTLMSQTPTGSYVDSTGTTEVQRTQGGRTLLNLFKNNSGLLCKKIETNAEFEEPYLFEFFN